MYKHTRQSELSFSKVLEDLGLNKVHGPESAISAFALHRYLTMYQLLESESSKRDAARGEYLRLMHDFEQSIAEIRFLRRSEMAQSRNWDFPGYLRGTLVLSRCRLMLRIAYLGHFLGVRTSYRLARSAGLRMFSSLFFEAHRVHALA